MHIDPHDQPVAVHGGSSRVSVALASHIHVYDANNKYILLYVRVYYKATPPADYPIMAMSRETMRPGRACSHLTLSTRTGQCADVIMTH